jgi:dTDP-4-dehydrorhamnose 3,5-epimerase
MTTVTPLALDGVFEITPKKFGDDRGFFSETWNESALRDAGIGHRCSCRTTTPIRKPRGRSAGSTISWRRGAQAKLLRVTRGSVLDVVVDIRRSSPTFGKWLSLELSADKWNQILVPAGFAHGYLTLEPDAEVQYKVSDTYSPQHERAIRFDDPTIAIEWPIDPATFQLSDKDRRATAFADADVFD